MTLCYVEAIASSALIAERFLRAPINHVLLTSYLLFIFIRIVHRKANSKGASITKTVGICTLFGGSFRISFFPALHTLLATRRLLHEHDGDGWRGHDEQDGADHSLREA
jgi:hypothetical protein